MSEAIEAVLADLGGFVEGKSDDEINAAVPAEDVEPLLSGMFNGMCSAFQPERAAGQSAVIQYVLNAADGAHPWHLNVADGVCTVGAGAAESPRLTMTLALPDFLRLTAGKADGMMLFMGGKLQIGGDMMFAPTMQTWFAR